jgi:hypothetical protein
MISLLSVNSLAMHEESTARRKADDNVQEGAVPAYLLDRENTARAKVCPSRSIGIQYWLLILLHTLESNVAILFF